MNSDSIQNFLDTSKELFHSKSSHNSHIDDSKDDNQYQIDESISKDGIDEPKSIISGKHIDEKILKMHLALISGIQPNNEISCENGPFPFPELFTIDPGSAQEESDALGFINLKNTINLLKSSVNPLPEVRMKSNPTSENEILSVTFSYPDDPLPGWKRDVILRVNGLTKGRTDIKYTHIQSKRMLRMKKDVVSFVEQSESDPDLIELCTFKAIFCICQRPDERKRRFVECSYGKCGCNSWIHPECVGLGGYSDEEVDALNRVVCPFCTFYLEGSGQIDRFNEQSYKILRTVTTGFKMEESIFNSFDILETNMPHSVWGLEGSPCSYIVPATKRSHKLFSAEFLVKTKSEKKRRRIAKEVSFTGEKIDSDSEGSQHIRNTISESCFYMDQPLSCRRRRLYLEDGSTLFVGVEGGYSAFDPTAPKDARAEMENRIRTLSEGIDFKRKTPSNEVRRRLRDLEGSLFLQCRELKKRKSGRRTDTSSQQGRNFFHETCLVFLPLDDGSIRLTALPTENSAVHLDDLCHDGDYCAFCFTPLPEFNNHATKPNILTRIVGASFYKIHQHCDFMINRSIFAASDALAKNEARIKFCDLYSYENAGDAECDLCGRSGGLMVLYQLPSEVSSAPCPSDEGWLAHIPCVNFLLNSSLLEPLSSEALQLQQQIAREINLYNSGSFDNNSSNEESKLAINDPDQARDAPIESSYQFAKEDEIKFHSLANSNILGSDFEPVSADHVASLDAIEPVSADHGGSVDAIEPVSADHVACLDAIECDVEPIPADHGGSLDAIEPVSADQPAGLDAIECGVEPVSAADHAGSVDAIECGVEPVSADHPAGLDAIEPASADRAGSLDAGEDAKSESSFRLHEELGKNETNPICMHDVLLDLFRCVICGSAMGIVPKCAAVGCHVRAHPLCVQLTKHWQIVMFKFEAGQVSSDSACFLCGIHSGSPAEAS